MAILCIIDAWHSIIVNKIRNNFLKNYIRNIKKIDVISKNWILDIVHKQGENFFYKCSEKILSVSE